MTTRWLLNALLLLFTSGVFAQPPVDTSKIGPQVGQPAPPIVRVDQFGKPQTLGAVYGPKGAMLVFFRSSDW